MRNLCVMLAAVAGSVLLCSPVRGDLSTSSFSFYVEQPNYNVLPSHSVGVPVYLQEAVTDPSSYSSFLVDEGGLFSAGVLVQQTVSSLGRPAVIVGTSTNNTDFDDYWEVTFSSVEASIYEMRDLGHSSGVLADETFLGSGVRRILLGTFTLKARATIGEVTTFAVADRFQDDTLTWTSSILLDPHIDSTEFTVTTVPVPSAVLLGLIGFGAGGLGLRRGRTHLV